MKGKEEELEGKKMDVLVDMNLSLWNDVLSDGSKGCEETIWAHHQLGKDNEQRIECLKRELLLLSGRWNKIKKHGKWEEIHSYHGNKELESHPQVASMTKVRFWSILDKLSKSVWNSRIGKSKTQKCDLDLLQVRFLEDLSLGVDRMHEWTPERVKELRLSPYLLHENFEGVEHFKNRAHKSDTRGENSVLRKTELERENVWQFNPWNQHTRKKDMKILMSALKKGYCFFWINSSKSGRRVMSVFINPSWLAQLNSNTFMG